MKVSFDHIPLSRKPIVQSWGDFLMQYGSWNWIGTVTFAMKVSRFRLHNTWRDFVMRLARTLNAHIPAAWVIETKDGMHHLHILLELPATVAITPESLTPMLRAMYRMVGIEEFQPFDPNRGWAWYMAKVEDPDINVGCPRSGPCNHRACRVAPGPWHRMS